jgi:hypothetical protein
MYLAIFALLSVLGGWLAWKRNPLYSARRTFHAVVLMGGAIGVFVGATIIVVRWCMHQPTAVDVPVLIVFIYVGSVFLIYVGMRIANPHLDALPPGTKLVTVNRRKILPWLKIVGWVLAAMGVSALLAPPAGREVIGIFAGILAGFAIFMITVAYIAGQYRDRALTTILVNPLVHWTYTPEQWRAFTEQEVARMSTPTKPLNHRKIWAGIFLLVASLGIPSMIVLPRGMTRLWGFLGLLALSALIILSVAWAQSRLAAKYRRKLLASSPEVFFGNAGLFAEGDLTEWLSAEIYLLSADIEKTNPPCLSLFFERVNAGSPGPQISHERKFIMIPPGGDADLAKLQRELSAICPKARISLI